MMAVGLGADGRDGPTGGSPADETRQGMNRRQQGMAQTRQAIIEAAGVQFAAHGYEGTSFARVAEAMGRPKSAVGYHQFPSKAALAAAVVESQHSRWVAIEAGLDQPPGIERLAAFILATTMDARACPIAAGATRLLHELGADQIELPKGSIGFDWYGMIARELRAEAEAQGVAEPPAYASKLLLGATYGVFGTADDVDDAAFVDRLAALWIPLFQSFGFSDAAASVERAVRAGTAAVAH